MLKITGINIDEIYIDINKNLKNINSNINESQKKQEKIDEYQKEIENISNEYYTTKIK